MRTFKRGFTALVVAAFLLPYLAPPVAAQRGGACGLGTLVPMGYEEIAVSTVAIGFTAATIRTATTAANYAYVFVGTNAIRWRDDGSNPTAAVGQPAAAGERIEVCGLKAVSAIKFIRQSADATLFVSYYRGE